MPGIDLPERPSLEYLRKLAKERLRELRATQPTARLSEAQRAVAREHGFPSWRALKAELDRRNVPAQDAWFAACVAGDTAALRALLDQDPHLVTARSREGTTGLHLAVRHPDAVQLLLERGAYPNARDAGDHALPLHGAAGHGPIESVRALLDGGSDVHGYGDVHQLDVIGAATVFGEARRDVVALLVSRGARHHIFSAIAMGEAGIVKSVVAHDPNAIRRRLSRFEQEQTALHYVIAPPDGLVGGLFRTGEHYHTLELLLALGADVEARDAKGRTPLEIAMLRGDREAMRLLREAGATEPEPPATPRVDAASLAASVGGLTPMVGVRDMAATVDWYQAIGFVLSDSHAEDGRLDWAHLSFGAANIMFVPSSDPWRGATTALSLWIRTDRLDALYATLRRRQIEREHAGRAASPSGPGIRFTQDLHTAFYGQREFGIRDPDGIELMFSQPVVDSAREAPQ